MFHHASLLFDAAAAAERQDEALKLGAHHQSFYKGDKDENRAASPYLFELRAATALSEWYFRQGWGQAWGLLVTSDAPFEEVYKHFRKFLMVKRENGQRLYFRFYDPTVLRIFLPTCDPDQITQFFGGRLIGSFILEDEDPGFAIRFRHENGILQSSRVPVAEITTALVEPGALARLSEEPPASKTDAAPNGPGRLQPVVQTGGGSAQRADTQGTGQALPEQKSDPAIANKRKWNLFD